MQSRKFSVTFMGLSFSVCVCMAPTTSNWDLYPSCPDSGVRVSVVEVTFCILYSSSSQCLIYAFSMAGLKDAGNPSHSTRETASLQRSFCDLSLLTVEKRD